MPFYKAKDRVGAIWLGPLEDRTQVFDALRQYQTASKRHSDPQLTIDLTYAKNALFIRQSVAVAFGIPIDRELTWDFLLEQIGSADTLAMPKSVTVKGLPFRGALGSESEMLLGLLRALGAVHGTKVMYVIHD